MAEGLIGGIAGGADAALEAGGFGGGGESFERAVRRLP